MRAIHTEAERVGCMVDIFVLMFSTSHAKNAC